MSSSTVEFRRSAALILNYDESFYSPSTGRGGGCRTFATFLIVIVLSILVLPTVDADTEHEFEPKELVIRLEQAHELARAQDPGLAEASFRMDAAAAQKDVARGSLLPNVSLFGSWSENDVRYDGEIGTLLPDQSYAGERYGFQAKSPLLNLRSFREYQRQGALAEQAEYELAATESALLLALVEAYLGVLSADEFLSQLKVEIEALEVQSLEAEALYAKGLMAVTQVLETQTRLDNLVSDFVAAQGQWAIARERLVQIIGHRDISLAEISDNFLLFTSIGSVEEAVSLAVTSAPEILAAQKNVLAARRAVQREKGSFWPEIDLVYNSQYSDVGFDNLTSPPRTTESLAVSFNYPLIEGGAGTARVRAANATYLGALARLEAVKRQTEGEVRGAWVTLESSLERIEAARQALRTAETNLLASQKAVKAGAGRVSDVLVALAQKTRAERNLTQARFRYVVAWLDLEVIVGRDHRVLVRHLSRAIHQ